LENENGAIAHLAFTADMGLAIAMLFITDLLTMRRISKYM